MVTVKDVAWAAYQQYAGPFFRGTLKHKISSTPDFMEQCLAVLCATEGGCYDSYNGYDRCVSTAGIIQWCEAGQYSVSNMLGLVAERCGIDYLLAALKPALDAANATFKKNSQKKWRFFFLDERGEVNSFEKQKQLFWNGSGLKDEWTDANKVYAKQWAASIANVWINPAAQQAQLEYTAPKLMAFVMKDSKVALFDDGDQATDQAWVKALRAAFISFAANLPLQANNQIKATVAASKFPKWTREWCLDALYQLTYGPNIAIYPIRYNAIRPALENFYGIVLPKTAVELKERAWQVEVSAELAQVAEELKHSEAEVTAPKVSISPPTSGPSVQITISPKPSQSALSTWVDAIVKVLKIILGLLGKPKK